MNTAPQDAAIAELIVPEAPPLASPEAVITRHSPERFINRELSWLDFNHRVVEEAEN
ncbi:MAG: hypothetical protein JOZ58_26465, partial [Acetobacteraceae bacterium]|nr:hypothetical protein [Acetobacteraceae bacterium]